MSDSKIDFVESAHSFPDFLLSKMEKTVKISNLGRKKEFKMEKTGKISIFERKKEFEMEKIGKISILESG